MNWDTIQQIIRIAMQFIAGVLVSLGYLNQEMAAQLSGAVLSLAGVAWWTIWNRTPAIK